MRNERKFREKIKTLALREKVIYDKRIIRDYAVRQAVSELRRIKGAKEVQAFAE